MRHRTHDHLFAAAGVTAALSLIGTGVTVLKGSVLEFSAWPVVGHDQPRRVTLPVAPVVLASNGGTSSRNAAIDGSAVGGTAFPTLSALSRDGSPIRSLDFSVPTPVIVPRNGGAAGQGSTGTGTGTRASNGVRISLQGTAGSLGVGNSSASDGSHNAPGVTPDATTGDTRTVGGTDTDNDGIPDTWATDTGTPSTVTNVVSNASARDGNASFVAEDPGTDPSAGVQPSTGTQPTAPEPAPVPADPAPTDTTDTTSNPSPAPTPADPAPPTDTTTATPPPADPEPSESTPEPSESTPEPTEPAPAPAPSDPAPPADPAPSQAPADPAPSQAPADPAPPADTDADGDDGNSAPAAAATANAAIPQSAQ
jgi:hypothetical protein